MNYTNKIAKIVFCAIFLLIGSSVFSQEDYEVLFIKGEYEIILQNSSHFNDQKDYYWNALVLDKKGEELKAIEVLKNGLKKYENNQLLEKLLINLLYNTGQYSKALPLLAMYLEDPAIFLKFIDVLGFDGEYREAINYLNEKIKTDSLNIEYLSLLGDYYNQIDSLTASIQAIEKLIHINPDDRKSLNKLANLYIKNKEYAKAINICDLVLANDSDNKKFLRTKGIACFNNANFDIAADCFKTILVLGDSSKFVLKHLGISEFKSDSFKESREHLLKALKSDLNDFEINYFLGKGYINSPTPVVGLYYLNRVDSLLQPDPKIMSTIYIDKQSIYSLTGKYKQALKSYEMAYQYDSKPEYIFFMASLYQHKLDDKKKALEYYERFISILPQKPEHENNFNEKQMTLSLRKLAENNIMTIKEELFFKGEKK